MTLEEQAKQYALDYIESVSEFAFRPSPIFGNSYISKYHNEIQITLIHVRKIIDPKNDKLDVDIEFYKLVENELLKMK